MKPTILLPETGQTVFTAASDGAALALAVGLGSLAKRLTANAASSTAMSSVFIFDSHFISPPARTPAIMKRCTWVEPVLVAPVKFTEWTLR